MQFWTPPQSFASIPWAAIESSLQVIHRSARPFLFSGLDYDAPPRAAVAMVLWGDDSGAREILLIQRGFGAPRHPGELAFPGGMVEASDRDLPSTARRELWEELGVHENLWELGCLPDGVARGEIRFTPVLFRWDAHYPSFEPNSEILQGLMLPIEPLMHAPWTTEHLHSGNSHDVLVPRLELAQAPLWGATAFILKSWLDVLADQYSQVITT